ncbi:malonyl-ACP decarboxylase [Paenibacillus shirakamiensis]|uniref:Malonyl-ACP decarboxylase n=1 Tax=Paenibacillus shirakamiensis TaxID=1265935 RepID=A0ABS4JEN7_9BACL|nr:beta-ketoacyl synthase N-terminal-like domain-containing protein [Paenibacillus shirakamiensis]MBP2000179.1 malonyl-ACP decarboxylase [Paenibacillus shirakamiensis]
MPNPLRELVITGMGVLSAVGMGKEEFSSALMEGRHAFRTMQRPGRQEAGSCYIGAEIPDVYFEQALPKRIQRSATLSSKAALLTLQEAWKEARLQEFPSEEIGLIVGGSNIQQREMIEIHNQYAGRIPFVPPTYSLSFMDSDICGFCTEKFGIQGLAYTVGGASASGQLAVIQAAEAVLSGQVSCCIAIGALMDLSYWECQAFRSLGAMGSERYAEFPAQACRPFDRQSDGFIYGEACAAVVIESASSALARGIEPYAYVRSWALGIDANRNPNPSYEGEKKVISQALSKAKLLPRDIDYINPHGSGSVLGDLTELRALRDSGLSHAYINATKSITGHSLTAAGAMEIIATILQMKYSWLHPTRNLEDPVDDTWKWIQQSAKTHDIQHALCLSMGFGGMNTAVCLSRNQKI